MPLCILILINSVLRKRSFRDIREHIHAMQSVTNRPATLGRPVSTSIANPFPPNTKTILSSLQLSKPGTHVPKVKSDFWVPGIVGLNKVSRCALRQGTPHHATTQQQAACHHRRRRNSALGSDAVLDARVTHANGC